MTLRDAQLTMFRHIKSRLPQVCWAVQAGDLRDGEFDDSPVLVHEGDLHLTELDLDRLTELPQAASIEEEDLFLLLVEGNLIVEGIIYNEHTDGSTGLIVSGDVRTRHMIVGGQEIYIGGNLHVEELFWGDYNHGMVVVQGDARALVWAQTEDYHTEVAGQLDAVLKVSNWDEAIFGFGGKELLGESIIMPGYLEGEGEDLTLTRDKDVFQSGSPLFHNALLQRAQQRSRSANVSPTAAVPPSLEQLEHLTRTSLMPAEPLSDVSYGYEFWLEDVFFRGARAIEDGETPSYRGVYIEKDDQYAVLIETPPGQPRTLFCRMRAMQGKDTGWYVYDDSAPEPIQRLLAYGWHALGSRVGVFDYSAGLIDPALVRDMLALPLAEPYDDYYDGDRNGFWMGELYYAFRQADEEETELFKVGRDVQGGENEQMECFFYEVQRQLDGSEIVYISYMEDEDDEEEIDLSFVGGERLDEAVRLFYAARKRLLASNAELLAGTAPYDADKFAMRHWRKQGYLKSRLGG